ncbi:MAG: endonuclease V [Mariniblastus sp.]
MIACIDVAYVESKTKTAAVAACLVFEDWQSKVAANQYVVVVEEIAEYVSGEFYKRELPPIVALLDTVIEPIDTIIVDGYVQLAADRAGLGEKLFESLGGKVIVVGVAKKNFAGNDLSIQVFRGESERPLFVTSLGLEIAEAAKKVEAMHGKYRLPTLLKEVDGVVRSKVKRMIAG